MIDKCTLRIARQQYAKLIAHLFPGDGDEHGAILLAGMSKGGESVTLYVRELHVARDGVDYVEGRVGYRALTPQFIHKLITRARDQRLVYLAVHNHHADREVDFSSVDMQSHEGGYPALLQIGRGMPVGALVLGRRSMQADLWLPDLSRQSLREAVVVGTGIERIFPSERGRRVLGSSADTYDRQSRMFGQKGQVELAGCRVAIVGLGGVGSLLVEYLARLGVGRFLLIDNDRVEESNLSRIVGASRADALHKVLKIDVARRVIREANQYAEIEAVADDVAKESVAKKLRHCDYIFLAADSMRARLVCNAVIQQYLIPGVQIGSKIRLGEGGSLADVMSANRLLRPGSGCLWCNQFIDPQLLAKEAKSDDERRDQEYGLTEPNPSVITVNAVGAAHAANDFLLDFLNLRPEGGDIHFEHLHHLKRSRSLVRPRSDSECSECSPTGLRFGRGDMVALPCTAG